MSRVIVRNADFDSLRGTVDQIFEDFEVDLKGKSVLIKPNFGAAVGPEKSALTDPRVVRAVLDACLEQTRDVVIGENPGNLDTGAMHTIEMSGILKIAGDYYCNISKGGEFVDIGSEIIPRVFLSRKVMDVDYLINVPKMKIAKPTQVPRTAGMLAARFLAARSSKVVMGVARSGSRLRDVFSLTTDCAAMLTRTMSGVIMNISMNDENM